VEYFRRYQAAVVSDWVGKMSGGGGLFFTVVGFWLQSNTLKLVFVGLGLLFLFAASYRAWKSEHLKLETLNNALAEKRRLRALRDALVRCRDVAVLSLVNPLPEDAGAQEWIPRHDAWVQDTATLLQVHALVHRFAPLGSISADRIFPGIASPDLQHHLRVLVVQVERLNEIIVDLDRAISISFLVLFSNEQAAPPTSEDE